MASISAYPAAMPGTIAPPGHEQKRAHLYVGNLSSRVTEYMLQEIFAVTGPVIGVKIIPDRSGQHGGLNFGFVEYVDVRAAELAMQVLSGRKIFDIEIKCNWAYQNTNAKEDLTNHLHVFVGDLSPEVTDEILRRTFSAFPSLSDARVMWDMNSGKSRGYGFLAFRDRADADQAIATMNGEWLGSRAIRVNWANQKNAAMLSGGPDFIVGNAPPALAPFVPAGMSIPGMPGPGGPGPGPASFGGPPQQAPPPTYATPGGASYEVILQQASPSNTTVYVGNLVPFVSQADLVPLFQNYGFITDLKIQADRGFAFVKLDTHENAAMAIANVQGVPLHGRSVRCSWGKDQPAPGQPAPAPSATNGGPQPTPEALSYAAQYAKGDPALIQQYAQYYMQQLANQ